jgi:hypothetical protein
LYFDNTKTGAVKDSIALQKKQTLLLKCDSKSPETQDMLFIVQEQIRFGDDELMIKYYQQYIDIVTKKGPEEMATVKGN